MILYFTGSGNSEYIAMAVAERLDDDIAALNPLIKNQIKGEFYSEKPYVIVAPIYAWNIPNVVRDFLMKAELKGNKKIYFIGTMGENTGNCDKYCDKLSGEIGMEFMGFCGIKMPNNFVVSSVMATKEEAMKTIDKGEALADGVAQNILEGKSISKTDKTPVAFLLSGVVNKVFNMATSSKNFRVSDTCIRCEKCIQICPVNNISMENEKITFGDRCINCYACIHHCPQESINIKGKTENNGRYVCPQYKEK